MSLLLAILYIPAVQYTRGGRWRIFLPFTLVALVLDVWCNYTELALLTWDFPRKNEWTFSTRLCRLVLDAGWRGRVARAVVRYLNWVMPGHV